MRNAFKISAEIDPAELEAVNRQLRKLGNPYATEAMKRGFRRYTKRVVKAAETLAPVGRPSPTEKVRGKERPNPHLKDNVFAKVKGYARGEVVWAAVGIREKRGSYETPHWYFRWVEFGHALRRRATAPEQALLKSRGNERKKEYGFVTIGRVKATHFLKRANAMCEPYLINDVREGMAAVIEKYWGRRG